MPRPRSRSASRLRRSPPTSSRRRTPRWCRCSSPRGTDIAALSERYDLAEYKQVEDDGTILLAVDTNAAERAELRAEGFRIGETIEDAATRAAVAEERDAQREAETSPRTWAENGVPRAQGGRRPAG